MSYNVPNIETVLRYIEAQGRPVTWNELKEVYSVGDCIPFRSKLRTRICKLVRQGYLLKAGSDEWVINPRMHQVVA